MKDTSRIQTIVNVLTGLFSVLSQAAIGFFLSPYIVSALGEETNGFAQLANNFIMYATLLTIAFNSMGGRFLSISYHQNKIEESNRYYSSIIGCNIAISTLLLAMGILMVANLEKVIHIDTADPTDVKILFTCSFLNFFIMNTN